VDEQVKVEIDHTRIVNFAMVVNDIPVVRRLRVENTGAEDVDDVEVRLSLSDGLAEPVVQRWDRLEAGHSSDWREPRLRLDRQRLASQSEAEPADVVVRVLVEGEEAFRRTEPLQLLAHNEWHAGVLPQLLSAFVQPNHPDVETLLQEAREPLAELTRSPAFDGYQSGEPGRVAAMAQALFVAVQRRGVTYSNPPASFTGRGQRIRLAEQLIGAGMGTCLDLTVLMTSCMEQAGLHPLLILQQQHAFPGVWLSDLEPASSISSDAAVLRNHVHLRELLVFDSSAVASFPRVPFDRAIAIGAAHLADDDAFVRAIDVRGARREGFRPLPSRTREGRIVDGGDANVAFEGAADLRPLRPLEPPRPSAPSDAPRTRRNRWTQWKNSLLDLSFRNRLLNFRPGPKTLSFVGLDLPTFEDMLAEEAKFQVLPLPESLGEGDVRSRDLANAVGGEDRLREFARAALEKQKLHVALEEDQLDARATAIARLAAQSLEETGANTLYVAIGMLSFDDSGPRKTGGVRKRKAPLLLVPVELKRRTARDGYRLCATDDDIRLNTTLLEKLRQDHGIKVETLVDEVPQDHAGADVVAVLDAFRTAIAGKPGWEVLEEAHLGHFSFAKYLMWRDLAQFENRFREHPLVTHLANPGESSEDALPAGPAVVSAEGLDARLPPRDVLCPLDADSSQLAAVASAKEGSSFVLQGPPGTGKSQTITNMIAHCVGTGRRVLFVAEKAAALEVVKRRLEKVGLGEFCLELHSNKAKKRAVIEQLHAPFQVATRPGAGVAWEDRASTVEQLRDQLNGYVDTLHRPTAAGHTVFRALGQGIRFREAPDVDLPLGDRDTLTRERLEELLAAVRQLVDAAHEARPTPDHPWVESRLSEWTLDVQQRAESGLRELQEHLKSTQRAVAEAEAVLGPIPTDRAGLERWAELALHLAETPGVMSLVVEEPDWSAVERKAFELEQVTTKLAELEEGVGTKWSQSVLDLDLEPLIRRFDRWAGGFFLWSWIALFGPRKALAAHRAKGALPSSTEIARDLHELESLRSTRGAVRSAEPDALQLLGPTWRRLATEWAPVRRALEWAARFRALLDPLRVHGTSGEPPAGERLRWLATLDDAGSPRLDADSRRKLRGLARAWHALEQPTAVIEDLLQTTGPLLDPGAPDVLEQAGTVAARWREALPKLRAWATYRRLSARVDALGLAPLRETGESGEVPWNDLTAALQRRWWNHWLGTERLLAKFQRRTHEERIREYARSDDAIMVEAQQELRRRLLEGVPSLDTASGHSEVGILRREIQKKRRHMPIRRLLDALPTLVPRLKPCLLMSPMSVAQYLGQASFQSFDLVIFDEASQVPVADAVGAIARGRQVVVVGDSKQLPPTNFFSVADRIADDEDDGVPEDLESILDECAVSMPSLDLQWHYRSRHESLITFSNRKYYGNRLLTFPGSDDDPTTLGVSFHFVADGIYDGGSKGTRTNRIEAKALVDSVVERLRRMLREGSEDSLGVVTFSQAQQEVVQNLLDAARRKHPEIEAFFAEGRSEPVFVKNLENIQGDERDVIVFSICYAKNAAGQLRMNFGPLNRDGGERRLNVAVTRARKQLIVFSSMRWDEIDPSRTSALGALHLAQFLRYAEQGPSSLDEEADRGDVHSFDSPFEEDVYDALRESGWRVESQVGCSGYRIDLAVVHPERPGRFLLGIECDGASYHSAQTARDRDRLRQSVLESLGWRLHRIWSTDWFLSRDDELTRLNARLHELLREPDGPDDAIPGSPAATPGATTETWVAPLASAAPAVGTPNGIGTGPTVQSPHVPQESPDLPVYAACELAAESDRGDEFYEERAVGRIAAQVLAVVDAEAPLHVAALARRIAPTWGLRRATGRVVNRVRAVIGRTVAERRPTVVDDIVWASGTSPSSYQEFRVGGEDPESQRKADELPLAEIRNAGRFILERDLALPRDELARELARLFGYQRTGRFLSGRLRRGVDRMLADGVAEEVDGSIRLVSRAV